MARMIPDYIHRDCKSNAERKLFERFKQELPDSYVVLHSLGLAKHAYKLSSEIDFVIICRRGLLCIEVKGGRIKQENGLWHFINRYDQVSEKQESPFKQASTAMFALRKGIIDKFGVKSIQSNCIQGYCIIFPDQSFKLESPEWDLKRLIDKDKINTSIKFLLNEQFDYSSDEIRRTVGRECENIDPNQLQQLIQYLRPNFEIVPPLSEKIIENHENLLRLTEEQYEILDQLAVNKRILIDGSAGTGKTLLAVEKARREVQVGNRVIFICYNKLLSLHIRNILKNETDEKGLEVHTLHGFARKLIDQAGLSSALSFDDQKVLFAQQYPDLFEQAVVALFDEPPFDVLIVDEGQDLKADHYLGMMDWIIKGGMRNGRWIWFEDNQQNIFNPDSNHKTDLGKFSPVMFKLTKNCRNTKPISIFNSLVTETDKQKCLLDSDLRVSPTFYKSYANQLKMLDKIILKLLGGGIDPADIVILSPYIKDKSILKGLEKIGGVQLKPYDENIGITKNILRYTTIHKFKGLESKIIVVTDITELKSQEIRSLNYVAFSRPTACLEILIHEDAKTQYSDLAYKFGLRS